MNWVVVKAIPAIFRGGGFKPWTRHSRATQKQITIRTYIDRQKTLRRKRLWALNSGSCKRIGMNAGVVAAWKTCMTLLDWRNSMKSSLRSKSPAWMGWQMGDHLPAYLPTASPSKIPSIGLFLTEWIHMVDMSRRCFYPYQKCHNITWHVLWTDILNSCFKMLLKAYPPTKCLIISTRDVQGWRLVFTALVSVSDTPFRFWGNWKLPMSKGHMPRCCQSWIAVLSTQRQCRLGGDGSERVESWQSNRRAPGITVNNPRNTPRHHASCHLPSHWHWPLNPN